MKSSLKATAERVAGYIDHPYTAQEIAELIDSGDYSAELMMQHLLLLVTKETP